VVRDDFDQPAADDVHTVPWFARQENGRALVHVLGLQAWSQGLQAVVVQRAEKGNRAEILFRAKSVSFG
jgi:hypothetical protein